MLAWLKNFETRKMKHGRAGLGIFNSTHWGQYSILSTQLCTSKTSFYFQGAHNPARRPTNPSDSYYWCPGLEPQQAPFHMEILCARQHPDFHLGQSLTSFTPLLRCDLSGMSLSPSPSPNPGNHLFFLPFLVSLCYRYRDLLMTAYFFTLLSPMAETPVDGTGAFVSPSLAHCYPPLAAPGPHKEQLSLMKNGWPRGLLGGDVCNVPLRKPALEASAIRRNCGISTSSPFRAWGALEGLF